jgi:Family of unknown function (DUF6263)
MKRVIVFYPVLLLSIAGISQRVSGKLKFKQGQTLEINIQVKTVIAQEAMGQAIDFNVDGSATHSYKVTNATDDNTTLHHKVQNITFNFDGMGKKVSFDSRNQKDMDGQFGKSMKEILGKTFDMIIDPTGQVLMVKPEKADSAKLDGQLMLISNMLKDLMDIVQPPKKDAASFFKVLPSHESAKGDSWTESFENANGKFNTAYTLTGITDSTIIIDYTGNSITVHKAEMMGIESTTTMNNKTTGKIIIDKATGIIREKTGNTESNGTAEVMGSSLPVTSKITTVITVK